MALISIIVCAKSPVVDSLYAENIKETIGAVEYELVWIDNSENRYSIFEAYNKGVELSNGAYLCFAHEDIVYHSRKWGEIAIHEFAQNREIGMLGVVGGHILTSISTCWWATDKRRGVLRQGTYKNGIYQTHLLCWTKATDEDKYAVAIDGVWMMIRRDLFNEIRFDAETYSGFHFYDMDISMQVIALNYKILIVDGIEIEHKSVGNVNASFYHNCIAFHRKWDYLLPVFSSEATMKEKKLYEVSRYKKWLYDKVYFPLSASYFPQTRSVVNLIVLLYGKALNSYSLIVERK